LGNPDDRRFRAYCTSLADQLRAEYAGGVDPFESWAIWTVALAQHYSLGSPYLDVTKDVDTALWFATRQATTHGGCQVIGPPGPFDPASNSIVQLKFTTFEASPETTGYLYVLDVPVWDGRGHPSHGELIDLSLAPPVFASSERMKAQAGGLIYAAPNTDAGDLSSLLACPPLEVPVAVAGRCATMKTTDLFPPIGHDHWYGALVSIPLSFGTRDGTYLTPELSVRLTLFYGSPDDLRALNDAICMLANPLLCAFLRREHDRGADWLHPEVFPGDAVALIARDPWYLVTPPLGDQWNEAITFLVLPEVAPISNPNPGESESLPLNKVLIEFSVLEYPFWKGIETGGDTRTIRRGLYIEREAVKFRVWDFTQKVPSGPITCAGPFPLRFDEVTRKFVFGDDASPTDLIPLTFKNFLVSLTLLRDLSERPLAPSFPSSTLDNVIHVAGVQGGGKLVRTESPAADFPIYLLPTPPPITASIGGMVVVKHAGPWAQVDAGSIQKSVDDGVARNGHSSGRGPSIA
jgi:hypothetical protein